MKLNNGEIERVVAISKSQPTRPPIDSLSDLLGKPLDEPTHIDLEEEPMLCIVDPVIEEGVPESAPA